MAENYGMYWQSAYVKNFSVKEWRNLSDILSILDSKVYFVLLIKSKIYFIVPFGYMTLNGNIIGRHCFDFLFLLSSFFFTSRDVFNFNFYWYITIHIYMWSESLSIYNWIVSCKSQYVPPSHVIIVVIPSICDINISDSKRSSIFCT